jgi:hypothetical protein
MQGFAALWNPEIIREQTTNKTRKRRELWVTSPLRQGFKSPQSTSTSIFQKLSF